MKVILTGSEGFIGRNLKKVLEQVWEVIEIDKNNCWQVFSWEIQEWNDIECIFHMGALSDTTETDPMRVNDMNVKYTLCLFQIAAAKGIPVKYASSASVYGNNMFGSPSPMNFYALSKLTVDYWVEDHMDEFSHIQGFRFFNVYGDGEEDKLKRNQSSPVSKFIDQAKTTGKIKVFESSDDFLRDFICVDDVISIMMDNDKPSGVYDLGTCNPISFQEVAEIVAEEYHAEIETIPFPDHLVGKYQVYTCSSEDWNHEYTSVKEYVKNSLG